MLIVVCGLPAAGKTTLSRALASGLGAVHLRIDTIEQAIVRSGVAERPLGPVGYAVAHALAADHLRQGLTVVAECVNPLAVSRDGWRGLAGDLSVPLAEVEVVCTDQAEHRRRAHERTVDIPGLPLPSWEEITSGVPGRTDLATAVDLLAARTPTSTPQSNAPRRRHSPTSCSTEPDPHRPRGRQGTDTPGGRRSTCAGLPPTVSRPSPAQIGLSPAVGGQLASRSSNCSESGWSQGRSP